MSSLEQQTGRVYWRSLEQLADTPEHRRFVENEFPGYDPDEVRSPNRRQFMKIMAASMALASASGCRRWPESKVAPYADRPEDQAPGVPEHYATVMEVAGVAKPLLAESYDGRPIKIEGNPTHPFCQKEQAVQPIHRGASDATAQASVLNLYDPDRATAPTERNGEGGDRTAKTVSLGHITGHLREALASSGDGSGFAVLSETTSSPTVHRLKEELAREYPKAKWFEHEPVSRDNEIEGTRLAFGEAVRPHLKLDACHAIVCFDADILGSHPAAVKHARDFARGRRRMAQKKESHRLYAIENVHTLTGTNADNRLALPSSRIGGYLRRLASRVFEEISPPKGLDLPAEDSEEADASVEALAKDLLASQGKAVLTAGFNQPPEVHALIHALNVALGATGNTVEYTEEPEADRSAHTEALRELRDTLESISTLLILGGNPVYDAPADVREKLAERLPSLRSAHLGDYNDETSACCRWHIPRAHYLESWADARTWDGAVSVAQPLIRPLWDGKTSAELLATVLGRKKTDGQALTQQTHQEGALGKGETGEGSDFKARWRRSLHDGFIAGSELTPRFKSRKVARDALRGSELQAAMKRLATHEAVKTAPAEGKLELCFRPDDTLFDGRFANNGWLQELPDPVSKLTWDNALIVSPATARKLGVERGRMVELTAGGRTLEVPVEILPGQADGTASLALGYGRTSAGHVGNGTGFDAYALRSTEAPWVVSATAKPTDRTYELVNTQDHHAIMDDLGGSERQDRATDLIREASLEEYSEHPGFVQQHGAHGGQQDVPLQVFEPPQGGESPPHRWGMSIDLNSCIGCEACVIACQAENNVPIVGKEQVALGREMHWIRVDRYFTGPTDQPRTRYQPMPCQQCENAPCEQVCPVAATVHDSEGLNVMIYNRCIGTRYCSNNCPYKVRRFNFYDWHNHDPRGGQFEAPHLGWPDTETMAAFSEPAEKIRQMLYNPEVTVRMRGVMEKCTFCVQRIQEVTIQANHDDRKVKDGEITPACAQACPTQAITFGDLNDGDARVTRQHEDPRSYGILTDLNTRPRTQYLGKITSANAAFAGEAEEQATTESHA